MTNCPNCGAPLDRMRCRCEYCNTLFDDLGNDFFNINIIPDEQFVEAIVRAVKETHRRR